MKRSIVFLIILCLLSAVLLAGCSLKSKPLQESAVAGYTVTDSQGNRTVFAERPQRILTLSMSTDEIVLGLVEPERMAAVNVMLDDPVSSNVTALARRVPARIRNPSAEEIAALSPDLVILPDWGDVSQAQSLRALGLPVVVCKGAKSLADIRETIEMIAAAVGEPERGADLLQQMDEKLDDIAAQVGQIPEAQRPSVVLISLMNTYGGIGCTFDEACRLAGVRNGMAEAGIRYGQTMSKEQLVKIDPDILFLPTYNDHGNYDVESFRNQYLKDPSLASLKAIRNRRLEEPFEGYLYNCSQDFVFGVQEIAYRVYGAAFAQGTQEHLTAVPQQ